MDLAYFDQKVNRKEDSLSYSTKWLALNRRYPEFRHTDVIPMWIADMEFKSPPAVIQALEQRASHGIYGYTDQSLVQLFLSAAAQWIRQRYHWNVMAEQSVFTPGVLQSVTAAIQEFSSPGDGVIIQPPVYYPFQSIISNNQRIVKENTLCKDAQGKYGIDFDNLKYLARQEETKILLLCNPHNPVGRVWTREELKEIADICRENQILIISDEIHSDFVYQNHVHIPIASMDAYAADHSITCYSPTKTFNIAGLGVSASFALNPAILKRLTKRIAMNRLPMSNVFGPLAGYVAYTQCEDYADCLALYMEKNLACAQRRIDDIPGISMAETEGTYFAWIDMAGLNLSSEELYRFLYEKARLATDFGIWFGSGGEHFTRLNLACPHDTVIQAVNQLEAAVASL